MSIVDINDRQHILSAIAESNSFGGDELSRRCFSAEHCFEPARSRWCQGWFQTNIPIR